MVLGVLFIIIVILVSGILYYNQDDNDKKKDSNMDRCKKYLIPGVLVGIVFGGILYFFEFPKCKTELLDEDFWE
jgi:hypothetical protein